MNQLDPPSPTLATPVMRTMRARLWAFSVIAIIAVLGVQIALPQCRLSSGLTAGISPAVVLAVFLAALFCEYIDSSLGMGYGTTLTPLLLLVGFEPLQIVPCVLLSEFLTGLAATLMHQRDGNVDLLHDKDARSTAILLSALSAIGAIAAVSFALHVSKFWLSIFIGTIVLLAGLTTLATVRRKLRYRRRQMIALGGLAAFNKGLSGGGYGPLVTAGQVVSGISPKKAVAITSLAESFTCLVGLLAYFFLRRNAADWSLAAPLTLGAMLSVPMATLTVRRVRERSMRTCVGTAACLLGIFTLVKTIW